MERIVEDIVDENLLREKLEKVIETEFPLPTRVIIRRVAEGQSFNAQAKKLGICGPTVSTRFYRGIALLKNRLKIFKG